MKKHVTLYNICRVIAFFEILMCIVWTLTMLTINGTELSSDHIWWFLLVVLTVASNVLIRKKSVKSNRVIIGMGALPMVLFLLQVNATFLMPYGAGTYAGTQKVLLVLFTSIY